MAKFLAILALALVVCSLAEAARNGGGGSFMDRLKNKRQTLWGRHGKHQGGSSSSSAAAAASAAGGSSAASAAAAAASEPQMDYLAAPEQYYPHETHYNNPYQTHYQPRQHYGGYQRPPVYVPSYEKYEPTPASAASSAAGAGNSAASSAAGAGNSAASSAAAAANGGGHYGGSGGASAASSAAAAAKQHYVPPVPYVKHDIYPQFATRPARYQAPPMDIGSEVAAATSAAAYKSTDGHMGTHQPHLQGTHIPAEYGHREVYRDQAPIVYNSGPRENFHKADSGIYGGNGGINENSYYKKNFEEEKNHEDGSEESDHYLSNRSHAKSGQENLRIRQGHDDLDQEITGHSMKIKRRNGFNNVDYNKSQSETGTSVLQKDRHRSNYNKDTVKSKETIDAASTKYSDGRMETSDLKTKTYVDDEDSEYFDSDGLHGQPRAYGTGAGSASASAAAGNTAASSSSAAAAGRY